MNKSEHPSPDEKQLLKARLEAAERFAELGKVTAGLLHDLKNPMTYILNLSEISGELLSDFSELIEGAGEEDIQKALRDDLAEELEGLRENINRLVKQAKVAQRIIRNSLNNAGPMASRPKEVDLRVFIQDWVNIAYSSERAGNPGFQCEFEYEFNRLEDSVSVYAGALGRVILNILHNAFYALRKKATLVAEFQPRVWIRAEKVGNRLEIIVEDNGTGIESQNLEKIFEPFFTTKGIEEGTGLGLHLTREIVRDVFGGEIQIKTRENEFTRVLISLEIS